MTPPERGHPLVEAVDPAAAAISWKTERDGIEARPRAHRRDVAQVDGERAVAELFGPGPRAAKVDPFQEQIGRDDPELGRAARADHGGIVADPLAEHRAGAAEPLREKADDPVLAGAADGTRSGSRHGP